MTRSIKADVLAHYLDKVLEKEPEPEIELDDDGNPINTRPKAELTPEERKTGELMQGLFMASVSGNQELVDAVRGGLCIEQGVHNWCARAATVSHLVDLRIGYLAGTFQPEIGNLILKAFHAEHPYYGTKIPESQTMLMDMARVVDDSYRVAKTREEEVRRKAKRGKDLGVAVPGAEEEVTSANATALLKAMRDKQEAHKADRAAKVEATHKAKLDAEIAEKKAAGAAREDAPFEF